jgi:hypothetical protein
MGPPRKYPSAFDNSVDILCSIVRTTCQVATAQELGVTQGQIRHRFMTDVSRLGKLRHEHPELERYYVCFSMLSEKFLVLRDTCWDQGDTRRRSKPVSREA